MPGASYIRVHLRDRKGGDLSELPEFAARAFPAEVTNAGA